MIIALDGAYNIFGTPTFQGYYAMHEQDAAGNARLGFVPNNLSQKPKLFQGEDPIHFLNFNRNGANSSRGSQGWVWVYVLEAVIGIGLILLYYFVALPGFEKWFSSTAAIAGLSAAYFLCAGLFEAYAVQPLLVMAFVRATYPYTSHNEDMSYVNIGRAIYWAVVVGVYF